MLFDKIALKGFWSVSKMKWLAHKKWLNFSMAHANANDTRSVAT